MSLSEEFKPLIPQCALNGVIVENVAINDEGTIIYNQSGNPIIVQRPCILGTRCSKYNVTLKRPNFTKWICTACGPICPKCREKHPLKVM
tara:strand:+ start:104 stop:373 length:270 start_codon:yes stop_codon:yes gene_type:complete